MYQHKRTSSLTKFSDSRSSSLTYSSISEIESVTTFVRKNLRYQTVVVHLLSPVRLDQRIL